MKLSPGLHFKRKYNDLSSQLYHYLLVMYKQVVRCNDWHKFLLKPS